jgi:hypothetical protein
MRRSGSPQPEPGSFPTDPPMRYPPRHEHATTISGRAADDPWQHARQRRAVARCVVLAVPVPTFGPRTVCTRCGIIRARRARGY